MKSRNETKLDKLPMSMTFLARIYGNILQSHNNCCENVICIVLYLARFTPLNPVELNVRSLWPTDHAPTYNNFSPKLLKKGNFITRNRKYVQ